MSQMDHQDRHCLFTIGHSNHPIDRFILLLNLYKVEVLVDTRSFPHSRHVPQYNRQDLRQSLKAAGIKYLYLGNELGGRPDSAQFYDGEGYVLYGKIAETPLFNEGIERLEVGIRKFRVAIMCSEELPSICHRHLLVGRVMTERGTKVYHIRGDGSLQSNGELQPHSLQQKLLNANEEEIWKSLQSVSPKRRLGNSSDF